jgi:lysophospholipase L1-like esterase
MIFGLEGWTLPRLFPVLSILLLSTAAASIQSCTQESRDDGGVNTVAVQLEAKYKACGSLLVYHQSNAKLPLPSKDETRVVFIGDSITSDWANHGFEKIFLGKPYINRGINSEHTPQILCRFRPDVIALKPKVVVILAGTNDIWFAHLHDVLGITRPSTFQAITENIVSMAGMARANDILVVLASLAPVHDYKKGKDGKQINRTAERPPDEIKALNEWIKAYAARSGHTYLDYHSAMVDERGLLKEELSDDGLHPNDNGYAVMAPLAEQAIAMAQKSKPLQR